MLRILVAIALISLMSVPASFSAAPEALAPRDPSDVKMGEVKDVSDKFTFVRVRFGPLYPGAHIGDGGEPWSHDYPEAGHHFSKILSEVSKIPINLDMDEYIFTFDDPNLFKYPFAYLCEVGYMQLSDEELKGMSEYLLRGGFLLVDDFRDDSRRGGGREWGNFASQVKRAMPEHTIKPLDITHPIFNCFFSIKSLDVRGPYRGLKPEFLGMEDKNGRLMMVINYNNDVSDYWQWSNNPFNPIEDTNTAYKFGVNYVFYALTR
ncbi:MAG TPA: DUF4159 domain-containing protein [Blastocatellia bacterium]|nr:DUF4159 domain-containing protein [Blastocatellia bacterium]